MKTIDKKYSFYSKVTMIPIQQSCLKPQHLKRVCFRSTVQKASPLTYTTLSLGWQTTGKTGTDKHQLFCLPDNYLLILFLKQVPAYRQIKEINSHSCFSERPLAFQSWSEHGWHLKTINMSISLLAVCVTAGFSSNNPFSGANLEPNESTSTPPSTVPVMP